MYFYYLNVIVIITNQKQYKSGSVYTLSLDNMNNCKSYQILCLYSFAIRKCHKFLAPMIVSNLKIKLKGA